MLISSVETSEAELWTSASFCSDPRGNTTPLQPKTFTFAPHQLRRAAACMECAAIMQQKWRYRVDAELCPREGERLSCTETKPLLAASVQTLSHPFAGKSGDRAP